MAPQDLVLGLVGLVVTVGMPLIIVYLKTIKDDMHKYMLSTEKRITLLEAKVFGFPDPER